MLSSCQISPNTVEERPRTAKNGQERPRTAKNGQERPRTAKNGQERPSDLALPSPFLDLNTPQKAWICHKIAASLPLTDRVFYPFLTLSPFPLPSPHRVVCATTVQPPLAQPAPTVLSLSLPFFYRVATDLVPLVYRHSNVFITFHRILRTGT